jgi:hypothetical protein
MIVIKSSNLNDSFRKTIGIQTKRSVQNQDYREQVKRIIQRSLMLDEGT